MADWIEELAQELSARGEKDKQDDALRLHRYEAIAEQSLLFFENLHSRLYRAAQELRKRRSELDQLFVDPPQARAFSVRNSSLRPLVTVTVRLLKSYLLIVRETRQGPVEIKTETDRQRIDFGIGGDDKLSLCSGCVPLTIDDVLQLILRPVLGL